MSMTVQGFTAADLDTVAGVSKATIDRLAKEIAYRGAKSLSGMADREQNTRTFRSFISTKCSRPRRRR